MKNQQVKIEASVDQLTEEKNLIWKRFQMNNSSVSDTTYYSTVTVNFLVMRFGLRFEVGFSDRTDDTAGVTIP